MGTLAESGADYVAVSDSVILEEGETSAAINVTILEVNLYPFTLYLFVWQLKTNIVDP